MMRELAGSNPGLNIFLIGLACTCGSVLDFNNIGSTKAFFSAFFFGGGGVQNNLKNEYSNFGGITIAV